MDDEPDDYEKLFLLEVLVDNVSISSSRLDLDAKLVSNFTDTCVMFQFLHYPPLVVCESDFIGSPVSHKDINNLTFKSGKSCFFSLRAPRHPLMPVPLDIKVSVIRKLKEGVLPDKLEIGKTLIDLCSEFTELLNANTDNPCDDLPLSRAKNDVFKITDESGREIGSIAAFVRLSCFGKLIITQFSLNTADANSYLFKGTDLKNLCPKSAQYVRKDFPSPIRVTQGRPIQVKRSIESFISNSNHSRYVEGSGKGPLNNRPEATRTCGYPPVISYPYPQLPYTQPPYPPPTSLKDILLGFPTGPYHVPYSAGPVGPPPGPYLRPLSPGPVGSYSRPHSRGTGRPRDLCDCPYDLPPSVMAKYKQKKDKCLGLAPGEVGLQDDQVIFQLPLKKPGEPLTDSDKQVDSQVYYKLTSAEETKEGTQKNTVNIKSNDLLGMAGKGAVFPVSGLPVDDGHDVFLLKIGKKCEGDKKRNLELELRTPKMKEPKPPMTDQNTQYLESDIPKELRSSKDKQVRKGKKAGSASKGGKGKKKKK